MVYIGPGAFTMGGRDEDSPRNEPPAHSITLSGYYIGKTPVTNQEYREFVQCTGYKAPIHWQRGTFPPGVGKHPVANVSWRDACVYAEWWGARLPTEAEWEKAAQSNDERPYPWGSRFTEGERCNTNNLVGTTSLWMSFSMVVACTRHGICQATCMNGAKTTTMMSTTELASG